MAKIAFVDDPFSGQAMFTKFEAYLDELGHELVFVTAWHPTIQAMISDESYDLAIFVGYGPGAPLGEDPSEWIVYSAELAAYFRQWIATGRPGYLFETSTQTFGEFELDTTMAELVGFVSAPSRRSNGRGTGAGGDGLAGCLVITDEPHPITEFLVPGVVLGNTGTLATSGGSALGVGPEPTTPGTTHIGTVLGLGDPISEKHAGRVNMLAIESGESYLGGIFGSLAARAVWQGYANTSTLVDTEYQKLLFQRSIQWLLGEELPGLDPGDACGQVSTVWERFRNLDKFDTSVEGYIFGLEPLLVDDSLYPRNGDGNDYSEVVAIRIPKRYFGSTITFRVRDVISLDALPGDAEVWLWFDLRSPDSPTGSNRISGIRYDIRRLGEFTKRAVEVQGWLTPILPRQVSADDWFRFRIDNNGHEFIEWSADGQAWVSALTLESPSQIDGNSEITLTIAAGGFLYDGPIAETLTLARISDFRWTYCGPPEDNTGFPGSPLPGGGDRHGYTLRRLYSEVHTSMSLNLPVLRTRTLRTELSNAR